MSLDLLFYGVNGVSCSITALMLFLFERRSLMAFSFRLFTYCIIVASGAIAISSAFGDYPQPEPQQVILNVFIAALVGRAGGQVSKHLFSLH